MTIEERAREALCKALWWYEITTDTPKQVAIQSIADAIRTAVTEETVRLRALALTCCSCKKALASLDELKQHIVACPEPPIAQYVRAEREACAKAAEEVAASLSTTHVITDYHLAKFAVAVRARG